jgi:hypothetical protein
MSTWWIVGFWAILGVFFAVFAGYATIEWWQTRNNHTRSRHRHPSTSNDIMSVIADLDRQFRDRPTLNAGHVTVTGPDASPPTDARAGDGVPTRKRPVDLRRDDILIDGTRVIDRGWPNTLNRFTVPVITIDGVYEQRHWHQSDAARFDTVEVRP